MAEYWNKTITLYNRYENVVSGQIVWYRHTLTDAFVKRTNNSVTIDKVKLQSDDNIVRIPAQPNYINPYLWENNPDRSGYMTLQTGDIIICGAVDEDIDEYTSGQRSTDVLERYKALGVMRIKSVNVNTDLPNKHYLIRGE